MAAALADLGRVALDVVLAVGPMVSSEHVAKTQHVMQMRHSRLESFREDVRDLLDERLDSSQNLTLKSTLLFGFVTAILVEGFPPQKMKSEMCVDVFLFLVSWGIALLFQSMTFAVLYQRGMMTVGHRHLRELQRIGSKQAEEEITQGPQTFADSIISYHFEHVMATTKYTISTLFCVILLTSYFLCAEAFYIANNGKRGISSKHAEFQRNLQDVYGFVRDQRVISAVQSSKRVMRSKTNDDQKYINKNKATETTISSTSNTPKTLYVESISHPKLS